ncbi:hypothetical protein HPP92_007330 [Vanilla planifolia]|uniref:protein-serine/threonine phosphatase n=1 Tax=Vanilla planifolia TaxID=51239 RepID=A0A835RGF0_VANPL|nr:hypothetical protein HPP92_007330 [Vanilla planifolia]
MAEREYALEMWRLLDPEFSLINSKELLDRIVCVKSALHAFCFQALENLLFSVFQDGVCHPTMSLVIDDRLKVWDEKDQPRVHVVPPFAPYFAPQAEANNNIPVLCVARNVACNVRGSFFKDFDEVLLPRMSEIFYEDEIEYPSAPDVGNYLISEDDTSALNGNKNPLGSDGMADTEVERRLKGANCLSQTVPPTVNIFDTRSSIPPALPVVAPTSCAIPLAKSQLIMPLTSNQFPHAVVPGKPLGQSVISDNSLQGSAREEGEVPESDLDPNTRRRLLILQHGQDTRDNPPPPLPPPPPPFPARPLQVSVSPAQSRGSWSFHRTGEKPGPSDRVFTQNQRLPSQAHPGEVRFQSNNARSNYNSFQDKYLSNTFPDATPLHGILTNLIIGKDGFFASDLNSLGYFRVCKDEFLLVGTPPIAHSGNDVQKNCIPVAALKRLVDIAGQCWVKALG